MHIPHDSQPKKKEEPNTVTPFVIVNFSHHEHLQLPKDHVVAFAEKDSEEGRSTRNLHHGTVRTRTTQKLDTRKKTTGKVQ